MSVGGSIDQLGADADLAARSSDAAFEHVAHAQFAPDLLDVDRFALVGKTGIAGDHEEEFEP